jgi:hypothetical protein
VDEHTTTSPCECNWPQRAVTNAWFPVTYDETMGEYQLVLDCGERGTGSAVLRHCPWCGGVLPESTRDTLFTIPTDEDVADVDRRMKTIETAERMLESLGEPTDRSHRAWRAQYTYSDTWESLDLVIHEYDDGHLEHGIFGKYKGKSRRST